MADSVFTWGLGNESGPSLRWRGGTGFPTAMKFLPYQNAPVRRSTTSHTPKLRIRFPRATKNADANGQCRCRSEEGPLRADGETSRGRGHDPGRSAVIYSLKVLGVDEQRNARKEQREPDDIVVGAAWLSYD